GLLHKCFPRAPAYSNWESPRAREARCFDGKSSPRRPIQLWRTAVASRLALADRHLRRHVRILLQRFQAERRRPATSQGVALLSSTLGEEILRGPGYSRWRLREAI